MTIGMSRTHKVRVYGETVEVEAYQRSKTVWLASGDFDGRSIEVKRSSESSAVAAWVCVATARAG